MKSKKSTEKEEKPSAPNPTSGYDALKTFQGKQYKGMKIGRSHSWNYEGEWKETKITPDLWEISFEAVKKRKGKAPQGSGVPVETEYHWYILAHQNAKKLNANDYDTNMKGIKVKLAHKSAKKNKWSISPQAQRKRLLALLEDYISQLEKRPVPLEIQYKDRTLKGEATPVPQTCEEEHCFELEVLLDEQNLGIIHLTDKGWKMKHVADKKMVDAIGTDIENFYAT